MLDLRRKHILITGAHGFLGKHVVRNLVEKRGIQEEYLFLPTRESIDLRTWENCQTAVKGQDIIIHLAATVGGIGFNQEKPGDLFYENAIMGLQLIEAARQEGVEKVIVIGTVCSYPKVIPIPFKEDDLWLGYPEETNASYGLAKKMLLVQAQSFRQQYGLNTIYLMLANLYGPEDNFDLRSSHVIPALIRKIYNATQEGNPSVNVWGTGGATREFLFVEDGAEGIVRATEMYDKQEPVNLGTGMEISIKELVGEISQLIGFKGTIIWDTSKPDGQPRRSLDISRAQQEFQFKAQVSLREGLEKTIAWFLNERKRNN